MSVPLRILLVEDSEDDALLLLRELRRGGYEPSCERVDTAEAMDAALEEREWDLVIADHSMPTFNSSDALELLRAKGFLDVPFIIVSGRIGEDAAVSAMRAGAHDYLMKDNLTRLNTAIERELREAEVRRERRRTRDALRVSDTRFRMMFEQSPWAIQIFSPDGRMLRANRASEKLWGVAMDQIPNYNILQDRQLVEKGVMPYIKRGFAGESVTMPPVMYEPAKTAPGVSEVCQRWVRGFLYPVRDVEGRVQEVVLNYEDITERREAEEERRQAEEKYREIFENAVEGIFQTTIEGRFVTANPAMARMFGYASAEELMEDITDIGTQLYDDPGDRAELIRLLREQGYASGFEVKGRRTDGSSLWFSITARAIRNERGEITGYEGTIEDVTERKRLEESLREIREAERRRIARELHDVVLQDLAYTLQSLQISSRMPEINRDKQTGHQIEALKRAVSGLRDAIYELRLHGGQEQPLIRTLESLVELNRQMAPECKFELVAEEGFPSSLTGTAGQEVVRIVQEALANVRRHSGASAATVRLGTAGDEAWVEVTDNGRGFGADTPSGMGLTGLRERAMALGGELDISSEVNAGTRVTLRVPLPVLAGEDPEYASV